MERTITFQGKPLTLVGRQLSVGKLAPDFSCVSTDMKEIGLAHFAGKIKILTSFPSIDTPVCDLQVKEFNKRAVAFSAEVVVVGISKDLPFAQKRFCQANDITRVVTLSDYKTSSYGINYGLQIKELNLLARSILIADAQDVIRYAQLVPELTHAPNFDDALKNLEAVIKEPNLKAAAPLSAKCKPCEGGTPPLPREKVQKLLAKYRGWEVVEEKKLVKELKFKDFLEAKFFLDLISLIAQEQGHHPTLTLAYNKLRITLTTHAAGGLTENDFIMAGIIDEL